MLGNRTEKSVDADGAGSGTAVSTRFAYDAWNPAKGTPVGTENSDVWADFNDSSLTTRYFRGDAIDQLLARIDGTTPRWYLADEQGSINQVIDSTGVVKDAIQYDAWGNILSETNAAERGRYAWTGREVDTEIALQFNRARYYDPTTGRWITQDPLGFDAGDSNLYRYVNNQSTMATDPSGNELFAYREETAREYLAWLKGDKNSKHYVIAKKWNWSPMLKSADVRERSDGRWEIFSTDQEEIKNAIENLPANYRQSDLERLQAMLAGGPSRGIYYKAVANGPYQYPGEENSYTLMDYPVPPIGIGSYARQTGRRSAQPTIDYARWLSNMNAQKSGNAPSILAPEPPRALPEVKRPDQYEDFWESVGNYAEAFTDGIDDGATVVFHNLTLHKIDSLADRVGQIKSDYGDDVFLIIDGAGKTATAALYSAVAVKAYAVAGTSSLVLRGADVGNKVAAGAGKLGWKAVKYLPAAAGAAGTYGAATTSGGFEERTAAFTKNAVQVVEFYYIVLSVTAPNGVAGPPKRPQRLSEAEIQVLRVIMNPNTASRNTLRIASAIGNPVSQANVAAPASSGGRQMLASQTGNLGGSLAHLPATEAQLANALQGISRQSTLVGEAIGQRRVRVVFLSDSQFERAWVIQARRYGDLNPNSPGTAFAIGNRVTVRRGSASLLSDTVHEGTHALDYLNDFMLADRNALERRAYLFQYEFELRAGMQSEFGSLSELLRRVDLTYPPPPGNALFP